MEEKDDRYSNILKYTGIFGGVQGINILVGVVRTKLVTWLLGPEGYGLVALFNSTTKLVGESTNLGLAMSAVHEISDAYAKDDSQRLESAVKLIRSWSILTALFGMLVCVLASPLLNSYTFSWGDHTLHFVLLSPVIGLTAITSGEMAVLKGTRQLRHLAAISIYGMVGTLIVSVPLYWFWREAAIVPSLVAMALVQMLIVIAFSYRLFPLRFSLRWKHLSAGKAMVWLGIAFVMAGIMGSGAELVIRAYLNNVDSLDTVGLYSFGYGLTLTSGSLVFSAMETEYFPRLSAIQGIGKQLNSAVNSQIEVSMLLVTPVLVGYMVSLPILLPLLSTGKFLPALSMMQAMVVALLFRAICLPIAYLSLARGDSWSYLLLEGATDVVMVVFVILGYRHWGLTGTGMALTLAYVMELILLVSYMRWRFKYKVSKQVVSYFFMMLPLVLLAYATTYVRNPWIYWPVGIAIFIACTMLSVHILQKKTGVWDKLKAKLRKIKK